MFLCSMLPASAAHERMEAFQYESFIVDRLGTWPKTVVTRGLISEIIYLAPERVRCVPKLHIARRGWLHDIYYVHGAAVLVSADFPYRHQSIPDITVLSLMVGL